jgi:hypothetical protein
MWNEQKFRESKPKSFKIVKPISAAMKREFQDATEFVISGM